MNARHLGICRQWGSHAHAQGPPRPVAPRNKKEKATPRSQLDQLAEARDRHLIVKIESTGYEPSGDRAQLEAIAAELNTDALDEQTSDRWVVVPEDAIRFAEPV